MMPDWLGAIFGWLILFALMGGLIAFCDWVAGVYRSARRYLKNKNKQLAAREAAMRMASRQQAAAERRARDAELGEHPVSSPDYAPAQDATEG